MGLRGDYYTSVSVGPLFGELLAWQFADWLREGHRPNAGGHRSTQFQQKTLFNLVEAGAHQGALARDILGWLKAHQPKIFERVGYCIVEPSEQRRHRQRKTLAEFDGRIGWVGGLAELKSVRGFIFSNELLDAFPVHRLGWDAKRRDWFEWGVDCHCGKFIWSRLSMSSWERRHPCRCLSASGHLAGRDTGAPSATDSVGPTIGPELAGVLPEGFTIEVCPAAQEWWRQAAASLVWGKLLTIDYGFAKDEQFAPERSRGTLRAYRLHQVSDNLLANPGDQDLTAHIDFGALQRIGEAQGLRTEAFLTQSQFLTGIAARIWDSERGPKDWPAQTKRQFQTLTHPEHLGRAFRVLVQSRP